MSASARLEGISALRGIAAMYVFLYHLPLLATPPVVFTGPLNYVIMNGGSGVSLFFIISAYTLALSMDRRSAEPRPVFRFYIRRLFRIAPLFWCVLVGESLYLNAHGGAPRAGEIAANSLFLFNFVPGWSYGIVPASWTIGVEMFFYALFPLFFRWGQSLASAVGLLLLSFVLAWAVDAPWIHSLFSSEAGAVAFITTSLPHQLPFFMIGLVCYRLARCCQSQTTISNLKPLGMLFLCASAFGFMSLYEGKLVGFIEPSHWWGLGYGSLALGCLFLPLAWIVNRATRFLGEISYSFYLLHPLVLREVKDAFPSIHALHLSPFLDLAACAAVALAVLVPIAWLSYTFIESPGIRFGDKCLRQWLGQPAAKLAVHAG